ncbi:efflux transporter outer membrane subunit [Thiomicrorhabdus sp.]|uniref:efflux transporter outer membrane subunit n=1 Tax=Thiomicrorhabdus sp. TaxID=2039724 RepID=UPI0029C68606|nr:efflux transporter outer membrane subunit [Thiomicrorhabdus sp.]
MNLSSPARCHPLSLAKSIRPISAAATLSVTLLTGCSSLQPEYQRPHAPIPDQYPSAGQNLTLATEKRTTAAWQTFFTDPQLKTLIEEALQNNRDLIAAAHRLKASEAIYGIQKSQRYPEIGVATSITRTKTPADLSFTGSELDSTTHQVAANLSSWEIDFWGRLKSLETSALHDYLSLESSQRAFQTGLIAQVANAYFALREAEQRIALIQKTVATREESYAIFKRRFDIGIISEMDLMQVETLLKQAQSLHIQLEQLKENDLYNLAYLVGKQVDLSPVDNYFNQKTPTLGDLAPGLPSDLLNHRPDIIAAEHSLKAATANIGAAKAAFFPNISLTGYAGTASPELSGLFASGSAAWSFSPQIYLPIFNAGRNQANLDLSIAQKNQAVANYEKTVQSAFKEVSVSLSNNKWLTKQLEILDQTLKIQQRRAELADLRYQSGASTYLEVLDAQRDLLTIEQSVVEARRALTSSKVALYTAIGGNLPQNTPPAAETASTQEKE